MRIDHFAVFFKYFAFTVFFIDFEALATCLTRFLCGCFFHTLPATGILTAFFG